LIDSPVIKMSPESAFQLLKTQNDLVIASRMAHWTVLGPNFPQYHELFERVYNTAAEKVDTTVELLRALGYTPSFEEFSGPGGSLMTQTPEFLVDALLRFLNEYYAALSSFRNEVREEPLYAGLVNLIEELMQDCTQLMFLLSSCK